MSTRPANEWHEAPDPAIYDRVGAEVDRLYGLGDYNDAYRLLDETWPGLPGETLHPRMHEVLLFKIYVLAHMGCVQETLAAIRVMHRLGYSCGLSWKVFDPIRTFDGYDEVERENDRLLAIAKEEASFQVDVRLPADYDPDVSYPLALVLHGDGSNRANVQQFWKPDAMLERGYIVAYPQSSQVVFTEHFAWLPDPAIAWKEVRACYDELCAKHKIDPTSLVLCGFSGGAITTVDLVFGEALPATSFICLCPEYKPEHFTPEAVAKAVERGVRGAFLEGSLVWPLDDEREMFEILQAEGLPIELILNKGFGHAAPPDFGDKLKQALDFVLT